MARGTGEKGQPSPTEATVIGAGGRKGKLRGSKQRILEGKSPGQLHSAACGDTGLLLSQREVKR